MTVAIACAFQDGVLFCADTKITTGQQKNHESKIHIRQYGLDIKNGVTLFTVAGDTDYAARAIQKCERVIDGLNFQQTSLDEMQDAIEAVLAEYYQAHIFPHPDRRIVGFDLLIGLWLDGETRILATKDTAVPVVSGYECVGDGGYLARYWLRQALGPESKYDPNSVTSEEASFVIEYAMNSAVEYDESCDYEKYGEAEYVALMRNGDVGDIREYTHLREFPEALRIGTWNLLKRLAKSKEDSERKLALDEFVEVVRKQHSFLIDLDIGFEKIKVAHQEMKALEEKAKQEP